MNRFTSVLSARLGASQFPAIVRSDGIGDSADLRIRSTWASIRKLLSMDPMPPDFQHRLHVLLESVPEGAFEELESGLSAHAYSVYTDTASIIVSTTPPQVRNALVQSMTESAEEEAQIKGMLFPPQPRDEVHRIVFGQNAGRSWRARLAQQTRLTPPGQIASLVAAWRVSGKHPSELESAILPFVKGVQSSAKRIARTEGQRVAMETRMNSYEKLGDMVIGYQIHATMDQNTRPEHAARSGTVYYKSPKAGDPSIRQMPRPPIESDGSVAFNCRCWLTPVLKVDHRITSDPDLAKVFTNASSDLIPDPVSYSDWFRQADEKEKAAAIGWERLMAIRKRSDSPEWQDAMDPDTGKLLTADQIRSETDYRRKLRLERSGRILRKRRRLTQLVYNWGFIP